VIKKIAQPPKTAVRFRENKLSNLLRVDADEINQAFNKASLEGEGTPQEISDRRELALKRFLEKYFPFPYRIAKGIIIDSFGEKSASIDTIVLNPIHPYTIVPNSDKYSLIIADGVDTAIEIKPILKDKELIRALEQGLTVKNLKRKKSPYLLTNEYTQEQLENSKFIPFFIFSVESYAKEYDLVKKIVDFYIEKKTAPEKQFDFICVNSKYLVINYRNKGYFFHQTQGFDGIAIGHYKEDTLAAFLLWLNKLHGAEAKISAPVIQHYLIDNLCELQFFDDLNQKLKTINKN
jgi:hypothetical protein